MSTEDNREPQPKPPESEAPAVQESQAPGPKKDKTSKHVTKGGSTSGPNEGNQGGG